MTHKQGEFSGIGLELRMGMSGPRWVDTWVSEYQRTHVEPEGGRVIRKSLFFYSSFSSQPHLNVSHFKLTALSIDYFFANVCNALFPFLHI